MRSNEDPVQPKINKKSKEFPAGPVVRTQRFHCLGPGWGTKILQNKKCRQKKKSLNRVKVKVLAAACKVPHSVLTFSLSALLS